MADATLNDLAKKLGDVEKAIKSGGQDSATDRAKASESAKEAAIKEDARTAIFQSISDKLNFFKGMKPKDEKAKGFFSSLLGGFKWAGLLTGFGSILTTGLSSMLSSLGTSFGPALVKWFGKLGPWALIISGLTLLIEDGIDALFNSEWDASGVSKFLGGMLGGTGSGIKNAFVKAGHWAVFGAGVGALLGAGVFSIPGAIIGGLLGAAIGGILGYIGGEKIAKSFDSVGTWFKDKFDTLILAPIKAVWDTIAPDWVKSIDFKWSDLFPAALTKLFGGKYFTVDFPAFSWTDLFPQFLVDLFNNVAIAGKETTFEWKDLLPKFFVKFFKGEYSKEGSFQWSDLLPEFINKIIGVAKTAWADTEFTWKSLVPTFIWKLVEGTEIKATGTFSWKDLVPEFIWKLVDGAVKAASTPEGFIWSNLLPDWMIGAWESTKGLAGKVGAFDWRAILPKFITNLFPTDGPLTLKGGASVVGDFDWRSILPSFIADLFPTDGPLKINDAISAVGAWDWKSLVPKFIQDFIADPVKLSKQEGFDWKDLLPPFIRDFFGDKKLDSAIKAVADFDYKTLLPPFIVSIINGTPILDAAKTFTWTDLVPQFIQDIVASATGKIEDAAKAFTWRSLVPQFILDIIDTTGKVVETAVFTWKKLLPSFIVSIIDGEPVADVAKAFSWKSLLPQWMVDVLGSETGKKIAETASLAVDWWKSLLPSWIVNVLEGKSPFAERDAGADEKKVVDAKKKLDESVSDLGMPDFGSMFDLGSMMAPIREKVTSLFAPENVPTLMPQRIADFMRDTLLKLIPTPAKEGGLVGLSPFAKGSMGKAMGLESGGLFTLSQGEMVLDNQAAQTFMKAAQLLTGSQLIEQAKTGGGSPVIVNNNNIDNSQRNSSSQATTIRTPENVRSGEPTMQAAMFSMSN